MLKFAFLGVYGYTPYHRKAVHFENSTALSYLVLPELGLAQLSHGFGALGSKLS